MIRLLICLVCLAGFAFPRLVGAQTEQHRATRLGNPATRFAPTITSVTELRSRFSDERLKLDMASVLQQWGWHGNLADLFEAALKAPVDDIQIPVGARMPFMSSRENGKPICLRNVLWAGREPAPAYAFQFSSKGQSYRCVTPKACSNFFVEDLGPEPHAIVNVECVAPSEALAGRPVEVCLNVQNSGTASEPNAMLRLAVPPGTSSIQASAAGVISASEVTWDIQNLASKESRKFCATFAIPAPSLVTFEFIAKDKKGRTVSSSCSTKVIGISAILIDAVDLEDPVEVGKEVTYVITVTNQGSAPGTNVRLVCTLPPGEDFVSGGGATSMQTQPNGSVTTESLPSLAPKGVAVWRAIVKATQAGDARFRIELSSDQFQRPILEEESTHLY